MISELINEIVSLSNQIHSEKCLTEFKRIRPTIYELFYNSPLDKDTIKKEITDIMEEICKDEKTENA